MCAFSTCATFVRAGIWKKWFPRLGESYLLILFSTRKYMQPWVYFLAQLGMSNVHSCSEMRAGITGSLVSRVHAAGSVMSCVRHGHLSLLVGIGDLPQGERIEVRM